MPAARQLGLFEDIERIRKEKKDERNIQFISALPRSEDPRYFHSPILQHRVQQKPILYSFIAYGLSNSGGI